MGEIPRSEENPEKSIEEQIAEIETAISDLRKSKPEGWVEKMLELTSQSQELRKEKLEEIRHQRKESAPKLEQAHRETEIARQKFEKETKEELGKWGIK